MELLSPPNFQLHLRATFWCCCQWRCCYCLLIARGMRWRMRPSSDSLPTNWPATLFLLSLTAAGQRMFRICDFYCSKLSLFYKLGTPSWRWQFPLCLRQLYFVCIWPFYWRQIWHKNVQEQNNLSCAQTRHLHNKFRAEWKGKSIALEMIKVILLVFG